MICILYQSFQIQPSSLSKARKNQTNTKKGKPSCGVRLLTCKLLNDTVHVNMTQSVSLAGLDTKCPSFHSACGRNNGLQQSSRAHYQRKRFESDNAKKIQTSFSFPYYLPVVQK